MHKWQLDYIKQFWTAYPDNRKFFMGTFMEAHEMTGELVSHTDEDFRDFFQYFYDMGYLDDTFIVFLADHGAHTYTLRTPVIPDNSREKENKLPFMFHITKNDIPLTNRHYLASNEQSFISAHDIYASLKTIAENKKGRSLEAESYSYIMEQVPTYRDCRNETVFLDGCHCWN